MWVFRPGHPYSFKRQLRHNYIVNYNKKKLFDREIF